MPIAFSGGIDSGLLAALIKPKFAINVELPGGKKYNESGQARKVARHLGITLHVVKLNEAEFEEKLAKAVKIIGKPIPHFSIFPLYEMYRTLREVFNIDDLVLADGPDESMCGYARQLIMAYLYRIYTMEAFVNYTPIIDKILPFVDIYYDLIKKEKPEVDFVSLNDIVRWLCAIDMELMRPDMEEMSDKLANHFGIKNNRPYEEKEVDEFMFNLPPELKIHNVEYGKYALRLIAEKYLPKEVAWRKQKVGGPVYPVNLKMGWDKTEGEFGKGEYLRWQKNLLQS